MTISLNKIASAIADALPSDLPGDMRRNIYAAVRTVLERMDLVTREELEVQEKVLLRTREKLEAIEQRILELEKGPNLPNS